MDLGSLNASRREFLRRTAALSTLGVAGPTALSMSALSRVAAADATDYKALVCVFLYGANDHYNTYVPYDSENHSVYAAARGSLATGVNQLQNRVLLPITALPDSKQYALAPQLGNLHELWSQQRLSVLLNVGPLIQPTSKLEYVNRTVPLPPKIFSHNDQQSVWQSLNAEGATTGWGGRMADLFLSSNVQDMFTGVSLTGNSVFLSGEASIPYLATPEGSIELTPTVGNTFGSAAVSATIEQLITAGQSHLIKKAYVDITRRSILANEILTSALSAAPDITTPFAAGPLSAQLNLVAKMIAARESLGMKRQVFFVGLGGFDVHNNLLQDHPPLLSEINSALSSFYAATEELLIMDNVTTFTASDFGRTLNSNGDGTDHGWGGHHMILGGAVNGGEYYGLAPELGSDGPNDVGRGRLLPTTAVEQMAATLGSWFGCSDQEIRDILPAISNFSETDLGFLAV